MSGPDRPHVSDLPDTERMTTILSTLAAQARRTNLVRATEIRGALQLASTGDLDADGWSAAERTAHQLVGSAGTFGYATASGLAKDLESRLAALAAGGAAVPDAERLAEALEVLEELTDQLTGEPDLD